MASLKEIKGRISSVSSTLKITSAMKLVASAKLRKAQLAIGNMLPYERQLHRIFVDLMNAAQAADRAADASYGGRPEENGEVHSRFAAAEYGLIEVRPVKKVAIVAFSSNSSLCGAFNSNVIKETQAVINEYRSAGLKNNDITVYSIGRKMQDAMKKFGFPSPADYTRMADSPSYEPASALAKELIAGFTASRFDKVELVYNHFKSTASQTVLRQTYLPMSSIDEPSALTAVKRPEVEEEEMPAPRNPEDLIIEPSPHDLLEELMPKVVRLRIFTTLLDSNAAEPAARTVAMQTATDNAEDLLDELTLEYNKGRQQKITSEILDIVGGSISMQ